MLTDDALREVYVCRHGQGKMVRPDGYKYDGEWRDDVQHGEGQSGMLGRKPSFGCTYRSTHLHDLHEVVPPCHMEHLQETPGLRMGTGTVAASRGACRTARGAW